MLHQLLSSWEGNFILEHPESLGESSVFVTVKKLTSSQRKYKVDPVTELNPKSILDSNNILNITALGLLKLISTPFAVANMNKYLKQMVLQKCAPESEFVESLLPYR